MTALVNIDRAVLCIRAVGLDSGIAAPGRINNAVYVEVASRPVIRMVPSMVTPSSITTVAPTDVFVVAITALADGAAILPPPFF